MNASLAALAFLMIILGAGAGFYPISVLGVVILVAALLVPSRPQAPRPLPSTQESGGATIRAEQPRAAYAPMTRQPPQTATRPSPEPMPAPELNQGYTSTSALFPTTMFPSMSPVPMIPQPPETKKPSETPAPANDLVEMAAIVVLLKMLSG